MCAEHYENCLASLVSCLRASNEYKKRNDDTASRSSTRAVSKVNFRALTSVGGPARRAPVICRQHLRSTRSGRSCPRHRHPNVGRAAARQGGARRQRLHRASAPPSSCHRAMARQLAPVLRHCWRFHFHSHTSVGYSLSDLTSPSCARSAPPASSTSSDSRPAPSPHSPHPESLFHG